MNPLKQKLIRLIESSGPLTLAEYMHICMADPEHGYYGSHEVIGRKGDFITAPEVSQMFGELIGVWCITVWQNLGRPHPFCLAELGPGKGSLMADLLRAANSSPEFLQAARIVLVETSERMREAQKSVLPADMIDEGRVTWQFDIADLPEMPVILVANEFFDIIPFRQYAKAETGWHEVGIGLSQDNNLQRIALASRIPEGDLPQSADKEPPGAVFEKAPAREAVMETIAYKLQKNTGTALIFDYGHLQSGFGDTFQAMKNHAVSDPLENPGEADLTSHVDFEALRNAAQNAKLPSIACSTQGAFLLAMGLLERAGALGHGKNQARQDALRSEVERLAAPGEMGDLFKVLAISSEEAPLPGFALKQSA